jgi:hypothetical protein
MKPEIKQQWITALQSGEYEQTDSVLRLGTTNRFCCLGVLCDLHSKSTGNEWSHAGYYLHEGSQLPVEVAEWAGLLETVEHPQDPDCYQRGVRFSELNDNGVTFDEIAQLIEEEL